MSGVAALSASGRASAVALNGIRRSFAGPRDDRVVAIDGLDLNVAEGELVTLVGPSGCGKSTLLRIVAGLETADAGTVAVAANGADATKSAEPPALAYVFQDAHLLPWRTVFENVALPLELHGARGKAAADARAARVRRALEDVELLDVADRYPATLSGGMAMRASIARALVSRPRLLLMDEPFAALDELTRARLDARLRALHQARSEASREAAPPLTILFVTHSIQEATYLGSRAIVFSSRPARIVLDTPIDLPTDRPQSIRTTTEFAAQAGRLFDALEAGAAPPTWVSTVPAKPHAEGASTKLPEGDTKR